MPKNIPALPGARKKPFPTVLRIISAVLFCAAVCGFGLWFIVRAHAKSVFQSANGVSAN